MFQVNINKEKTLNVDENINGLFIDGDQFDWDIIQTHANRYHIIKDFKSYDLDLINVDYKNKSLTVKLNNQTYDIEVKNQLDLLLQKLGMNNTSVKRIKDLKAPMSGKIIEVSVAVGDKVKKGDQLGIIEAMKMENIIRCPTDGVIKEIKIKPENQVEKNQKLIVFE